MLEVGNLWSELGDAEGRSQMSMWSVMKAPLLLGTGTSQVPQTRTVPVKIVEVSLHFLTFVILGVWCCQT
jgi:hypothetical protein